MPLLKNKESLPGNDSDSLVGLSTSERGLYSVRTFHHHSLAIDDVNTLGKPFEWGNVRANLMSLNIEDRYWMLRRNHPDTIRLCYGQLTSHITNLIVLSLSATNGDIISPDSPVEVAVVAMVGFSHLSCNPKLRMRIGNHVLFHFVY